jgi:branched-chain amino acid transport system substrate-binding protein
MKKNIFVLVVTLLAVLTLFYAHTVNAEVRGVTDKEIKVGLIAAMTGIGSDTWLPMASGLKTYIEMINDEGGIHGRKIKFIVEDDRYTIPLTLSCFKKLTFRDKIFILVGPSGVGQTGAIFPLVEKEKIPLLGATTEKRLFYPPKKYLFGVMVFYDDQAKLSLEYIINDLKIKNPAIVLLYPDVLSGKESRDAMRDLVKKYPVKKYDEIVYPLFGIDFSTEALRLKQLKPDAVYLHAIVATSGLIVKLARSAGLTAPIIMNQYSVASPKTVQLAGKKATDLFGINAFGAWDENTPGMKKMKIVSLKYNPNCPYRNSKDTNYVGGWFYGLLLHEGLKNAGRSLDEESFLKGMEAIRNFDTQGVCGVISLGPDDHKSIKEHRFHRADLHKMEFVPVTGWRKAD